MSKAITTGSPISTRADSQVRRRPVEGERSLKHRRSASIGSSALDITSSSPMIDFTRTRTRTRTHTPTPSRSGDHPSAVVSQPTSCSTGTDSREANRKQKITPRLKINTSPTALALALNRSGLGRDSVLQDRRDESEREHEHETQTQHGQGQGQGRGHGQEHRCGHGYVPQNPDSEDYEGQGRGGNEGHLFGDEYEHDSGGVTGRSEVLAPMDVQRQRENQNVQDISGGEDHFVAGMLKAKQEKKERIKRRVHTNRLAVVIQPDRTLIKAQGPISSSEVKTHLFHLRSDLERGTNHVNLDRPQNGDKDFKHIDDSIEDDHGTSRGNMVGLSRDETVHEHLRASYHFKSLRAGSRDRHAREGSKSTSTSKSTSRAKSAPKSKARRRFERNKDGSPDRKSNDETRISPIIDHPGWSGPEPSSRFARRHGYGQGKGGGKGHRRWRSNTSVEWILRRRHIGGKGEGRIEEEQEQEQEQGADGGRRRGPEKQQWQGHSRSASLSGILKRLRLVPPFSSSHRAKLPGSVEDGENDLSSSESENESESEQGEIHEGKRTGRRQDHKDTMYEEGEVNLVQPATATFGAHDRIQTGVDGLLLVPPDKKYQLDLQLDQGRGQGHEDADTRPGRPYRSPGTASFLVNREGRRYRVGEDGEDDVCGPEDEDEEYGEDGDAEHVEGDRKGGCGRGQRCRSHDRKGLQNGSDDDLGYWRYSPEYIAGIRTAPIDIRIGQSPSSDESSRESTPSGAADLGGWRWRRRRSSSWELKVSHWSATPDSGSPKSRSHSISHDRNRRDSSLCRCRCRGLSLHTIGFTRDNHPVGFGTPGEEVPHGKVGAKIGSLADSEASGISEDTRASACTFGQEWEVPVHSRGQPPHHQVVSGDH